MNIEMVGLKNLGINVEKFRDRSIETKKTSIKEKENRNKHIPYTDELDESCYLFS